MNNFFNLFFILYYLPKFIFVSNKLYLWEIYNFSLWLHIRCVLDVSDAPVDTEFILTIQWQANTDFKKNAFIQNLYDNLFSII